jgi:hypothetical protein
MLSIVAASSLSRFVSRTEVQHLKKISPFGRNDTPTFFGAE